MTCVHFLKATMTRKTKRKLLGSKNIPTPSSTFGSLYKPVNSQLRNNKFVLICNSVNVTKALCDDADMTDREPQKEAHRFLFWEPRAAYLKISHVYGLAPLVVIFFVIAVVVPSSPFCLHTDQ